MDVDVLPPAFDAAGLVLADTDAATAADVARRAWLAGVACTGWAPAAAPVVRLGNATDLAGFDGRAHLTDAGLVRIELLPTATRSTLVHEIGHAWFHGEEATPPALVEGRTDVLADCMVAADGTLGPRRDKFAGPLDRMPDLVAWTNPDGADPALREAAYRGAYRVMRAAAAIVPPDVFWHADALRTWDDLFDRLDAAGPIGAELAGALDRGAASQRVVLGDADIDGRSRVEEQLAGTDPSRWDTDGDGWWDGYDPRAAPPGARPLPPLAAPVCTDLAAGPSGGQVVLSVGGTGPWLPDWLYLWVDGVGQVAPVGAPIPVPGGATLLVQGPDISGARQGVWVAASGTGLVPARPGACETVLAAIRSGRQGLAERLSDVDRDGKSAVAEAIAGTDPYVWDSDGDGWWDGFDRSLAPPGAFPLRMDGGPTCADRIAGPGGSAVQVVLGGTARRLPDTVVVWLDDERHTARVGDTIRASTGAVIRVQSPVGAGNDTVQGLWAVVSGDRLHARPGCRPLPGVVVNGDDVALVFAVESNLREPMDRASTLLGLDTSPLRVHVGGASTGLSNSRADAGVVTLATSLAASRPDEAAALAVAWHRLAAWPAALEVVTVEALAWDLLGRTPPRPIVATRADEVRARRADVARCGGWAAWLEARCGDVIAAP